MKIPEAAITAPVSIIVGDVLDGLRSLPDGCVQCCCTSPPYWGLRDYGVEGQIGLEATPDEFVARMVEVFGEVKRVLREDGTLWLNLGDSYAGSGRGGYAGGMSTLNGGVDGQNNNRAAKERQRKGSQAPTVLHARAVENGAIGRAWTPVPEGMKQKDLCMMPWRVAMALQADGWWIRSVICWAKKSPMPESCRDRPTSSWEPIFLLTKAASYYYDAEAVREEGEGYGRGSAFRAPRYTNNNSFDNSAMAETQTNTHSFAGGRNLRNVWHLGPEPFLGSHFATFPTEIPRRAIKAGTSEKGCCPKCGAGWVREVEAWHENPGNRTTNGPKHKTKEDGQLGSACYDQRLERRVRTLGWEPACACNAGAPVPCLVLDPFLGSGTTVAVARELGRHGVGIELNPEYADLARERIGRAEKPQTFRTDKATEGGLFAPIGENP